jgi:hypothetical protein
MYLKYQDTHFVKFQMFKPKIEYWKWKKREYRQILETLQILLITVENEQTMNFIRRTFDTNEWTVLFLNNCL